MRFIGFTHNGDKSLYRVVTIPPDVDAGDTQCPTCGKAGAFNMLAEVTMWGFWEDGHLYFCRCSCGKHFVINQTFAHEWEVIPND